MTMVAIKEIREKVDITQQEKTDYKIVMMENRIVWDDSAKDYEADFEFAKSHIALIDEALQKISKENEMTEMHLSLYQKFCLDAKSNPMKIIGDE